jgi:hypothetical protein
MCVLPLQEEALQVTGETDAQAAAEAVLNRPNAATEWCVVKMGGEGAVLVTKTGEVHRAPAFKVTYLACDLHHHKACCCQQAILQCRLRSSPLNPVTSQV